MPPLSEEKTYIPIDAHEAQDDFINRKKIVRDPSQHLAGWARYRTNPNLTRPGPKSGNSGEREDNYAVVDDQESYVLVEKVLRIERIKKRVVDLLMHVYEAGGSLEDFQLRQTIRGGDMSVGLPHWLSEYGLDQGKILFQGCVKPVLKGIRKEMSK